MRGGISDVCGHLTSTLLQYIGITLVYFVTFYFSKQKPTQETHEIKCLPKLRICMISLQEMKEFQHNPCKIESLIVLYVCLGKTPHKSGSVSFKSCCFGVCFFFFFFLLYNSHIYLVAHIIDGFAH